MGSGSLVAVDANHGLVITNWHVVRDAAGPVTVLFPSGFGSSATILKVDRVWDLAALAIQRPNVQPIVLSTEPPRPGEVLTIAGYGPTGSYRAVSGQCTNYGSPTETMPKEWVELDTAARQGDSGGPIFNSKGELAGVLFGANNSVFTGGYTMGSYCGRVRVFLASVSTDFQRLPAEQALIAQTAPPARTVLPTAIPAYNGSGDAPAAGQPYAQPQGSTMPRVADARPMVPVARPPAPGVSTAMESQRPMARTQGQIVAAGRPGGPPGASVPAANGVPVVDTTPTRGEQIKTILAVIGIISILFHGIRLIGASVG
jgi:hypothetical protein